MNVWMPTYTGKRVDLENPLPEQIDPLDICHGLSLICRYSGQCIRFYSVAEHTSLVLKLYRWHNGGSTSGGMERLILLHDAAEAYITDLPRPVKRLVQDQYGAVEGRLMRAIHKRFKEYPEPSCSYIKQMDNLAIAAEIRELWADRSVPMPRPDDHEKIIDLYTRHGYKRSLPLKFTPEQAFSRLDRLFRQAGLV